MLMNINLTLFFSMLNLSILLGTSTNSLLFLWMMIEMNMISFIPILYFLNTPSNKDIFMKYFLIQSFSSSLMLISMFFFSLMNYSTLFLMMILLTILMKMGTWPFLWWYMHLLINMDWSSNFLLMTSQKMLPFYLFHNINSIKEISYIINLIYLILIFNLISSFFMIMNTNLLKLIISASSLNQMTWFLNLLIWDYSMWFNYFMIYSIILFITTSLFKFFNLTFIHDIHFITFYYKILILILTIFFIMLPPTINFYLKVLSIKIFSLNSYFFISFMLCLSTIFAFYLKILFPSILFFKTNYFYLKNFIKINKMFLIFLVTIYFTLFYWMF
uniref:NADH-ubiquinone oxidoreductase chain 2 n=1 Tax=Leptopilina syphax TaxID=2755057 RepID=A0A7D6FID8_9HYME|nr:NADH dehydrogenase subunit 2 [Leptopilina syphax]